MSGEENKEIFPIAIFLDTNILDSLPENLRSGDLSGLVADADNIGASVYIPDVVAREWLEHRMDKFFHSLENYEKSRSHIKKYFSDVSEFRITVDDFMDNVYRFLISHLKKSGCRLLGPPKVTINSLTRRAVCKTPPFKNANRGFKDELVILSMLKLVRRGRNYKTYVLVTKDNDFLSEELKKRFSRFKVKFDRVNSLQYVRKLLDEKLDAAWKQRKTDLETEVKGFLSGHWDTISQAVVREVEEKGVTWSTIFAYGKDDISRYSNIRKIVKSNPIQIQGVDVGSEDEDTHEIPVTIGVNTRLSLEVEENPFLYRAFLERIGTEGRKLDRTPTFESQSRTIVVNREIYIYAVLKRNESGVLTEFQLVDMRPDFLKFIEKIDKERETSQ